MKKTITLALALLIALPIVLAGVAHYKSSSSSPVPIIISVCSSACDYTTIQGAIYAANNGDTILVLAGTYNEHIIVNKSLIILGAQNEVDARTRSTSNESIIDSGFSDGTIQIQADNVRIDGFSIINSNKAIHVTQDSANVIIKNNIIENSDVDGINLWRASNADVENNLVSGAGTSGITAGDDRGTSNKADDLVTRTTIKNNIIENSRYGITGYQKNSVISENIVRDYSSSDGAGIGGQFTSVDIHNNEIHGYTNGAGFALSSYANRPDSSHISFENNTVTGNGAGIYVNQDVTSKFINLNYNQIFGNSLFGILDVNQTGTLNAENNWWGSCSGPGGIGTGSGNPISGNVDFEPWLGVCIETQFNVTCAFKTGNISIISNLNGENIEKVWVSAIINSTQKNYTAVPSGSGNYTAIIPSYDLVGGQSIDWNVYAKDSLGIIYSGSEKSFYVGEGTKLSVSPSTPDGLNGWYISEPIFSLTKDVAGNSYYQWYSKYINLYSAIFGLENAPNNANITGGLLDLIYWSDFGVCGNETKQTEVLKIDLTKPDIKNMIPAPDSVVLNNLVKIYAYIDDPYGSNSGINTSSIVMMVDGFSVSPIIQATGLDAKVNYTVNLSLGTHTVSISTDDKAGLSSFKEWSFDVSPAPEFFINVHSPNVSIYEKKRMLFNITTNDENSSLINVDKIEYINYNDKKPRWTVFCTNCNKYERARNVNEGQNNITIKVSSGETVKEANISVFVDSKKPRISSVLPKKKSVTNGSDFYIKYSETNLDEVKLFWDDKNKTLNCSSGEKQECRTSVDLSEYDGSSIVYWFEVSDSINTVVTKPINVSVDTTSPVLTVNMPQNGTYTTKKVPFNISVSEKVKIEYTDLWDSSPKWRTICENCNEYGLTKLKTPLFNKGIHEIRIRATDEAGNSDQEGIGFFVDY